MALSILVPNRSGVATSRTKKPESVQDLALDKVMFVPVLLQRTVRVSSCEQCDKCCWTCAVMRCLPVSACGWSPREFRHDLLLG